MTYDEALKYIHGISWRGSRLGLDRTRELLAYMGNPQDNLKFIHIAGTNGKGSVSAMLASILKSQGYKTGFYTSPYILTFNERMQINGNNIEDNELAEITGYVSHFAEKMVDLPTEFELITAVAFEYFNRNSCDIVVLETGMGGELDSTNIIKAPELAIITTIDYDHVRELGPTMKDIARAKAGIIKKGTRVLFYGENEEAREVIAEKCSFESVPFSVCDFTKISNKKMSLDKISFHYDSYTDIELPLIGIYQFKNAALVLSAVEVLRYNGLFISLEAVRNGLGSVKWPGRFEILKKDPLFISDGGHNPQGVHSAIESFKAHLPDKKAIFILGIMADKNVDEMINIIKPVALEFITVTPDNPRSMPAELLKEKLIPFGLNVTACYSVEEGVKKAISSAGENGIVFSLGSLYLYKEVKGAIEGTKK